MKNTTYLHQGGLDLTLYRIMQLVDDRRDLREVTFFFNLIQQPELWWR